MSTRAKWTRLVAEIGACRRCTPHLATDVNARPLFTKYEPSPPRKRLRPAELLL